MKLALVAGALVFAILQPWPRPRVALREACDLEEAGRFAVQCDLDQAARRSGREWLRRSLAVYEDGVRLRQADRAADVKRENPGSFHTSGRVLTLASLDRGDPRSNARAYVVRAAEFDPLGLAGSRRELASAVAIAFLLACFVRRRFDTLLLVASTCTIAGLLVQLAAVFSESPIHVDAGYAIPAAEAIARGARPYTSLLFNYTPLGVYEFAAWSRAWPAENPPPYAWYLGLVVLNEAGCAGIVFVLARAAGVARDLAALTALGYLSMTLWFDGGRILFEPLYLLPVLGAAFLVSREATPRNLAAAGALSAVAFLTKQYGGFALAGALFSLLVSERDRLRRIAALVAGFTLTLGALLALLYAAGLDANGFLVQAIGPNYPRRFETGWLRLFLRQCAVVLPALAVPFLPGAWSRPAVRVSLCFLVASCGPFYFRQHQYYFLNVCPWLFLLFALGATHVSERWPAKSGLITLAAALLLVSMPIRGAAAQAAWLQNETRSEQLRRARLMNDAWPAGLRTLMLLYPGFSQMTHYRSPDETAIGYRFPHEVTAEQLRLGFEKAAGAWIDPRGMYARGADRTLRAAGGSLDGELQRNGFEKRQVIEERFELWVKKDR